MLRSEPGTLLETVAGTMTMGTQNSSYVPRAANNSWSDKKACRAEPRALVSQQSERWQVGVVERCYLPQVRKRNKWRVPRGGARSITTDSSETDRYHSTYTKHVLSHKHMILIYLHTSQENKSWWASTRGCVKWLEKKRSLCFKLKQIHFYLYIIWFTVLQIIIQLLNSWTVNSKHSECVF